MYNFPEAENKILKFWQDNKIFEKLRQKNKKGKPWSFLDGPITANNPMGAHHAWGRSYKDRGPRPGRQDAPQPGHVRLLQSQQAGHHTEPGR